MGQYNLSSVTFLFLFRIRKNCFNNNNKNQLLYFYMKRVIKEFVIIVED